MNIKDAYVCPKCGDTHPTVFGVQTLMEDVRFDLVGCSQCKTEWRVYYKTSEVTTEVTFVAPESETETVAKDLTEPVRDGTADIPTESEN